MTVIIGGLQFTTLSAPDLINKGGTHVILPSYFSVAHACENFRNFRNGFVREFYSWMIFPAHTISQAPPLIFRIIRPSKPFKIFQSIIKLITIDMIYRHIRRCLLKKGQADETVNKKSFPLLCANARGNSCVTLAVNPNAQITRRDGHFMDYAAFSNPASRAGFPSHSSTARYLQIRLKPYN